MIKMSQILFGLLLVTTVIQATPRPYDLLPAKWKAWKELHGRCYDSKEEENKRFKAYVSNTEFIQSHNFEASSGKHSYFLKMNQFGDMSHSEFLAKYVGKGQSAAEGAKKVNISNIYTPPKHMSVPTEFDWRSKGAVTPVGDQKDCDDCSHYFAAVGNMEGQIFLKYHKLIQLSVQELVDCGEIIHMDTHRDWTDGQLKVLMLGGIETGEDYPYHGKKRGEFSCRFDKKRTAAYLSNRFRVCISEKCAADFLVKAGPLANVMDGSQRSFQFYSHGVYSEPKCRNNYNSLHQGGLIVGYGVTKDHEKYWNVKNSWGTGWGENGYIRIAKDRNNTCGVAAMAGSIDGVYLRV